MAITVTHLTNGAGTGTADKTTASITPGANKLILVAVNANNFSGTPSAPTLSGNSLTYVSIVDVTFSTIASATSRFTLFRAMGASPSSGAITITPGSTNSCMWAVAEVDGVDTSGTDGSGAIVQNATNRTDGDAPNSLTVTLAALADAVNNAVYAAFGPAGDTLQTPAATYTELSDDDSLTGGAATCSLMTMYKVPGTTTPSASGQPDFGDIAGIAVEIKAAAAAAGWGALLAGSRNNLVVT